MAALIGMDGALPTEADCGCRRETRAARTDLRSDGESAAGLLLILHRESLYITER
jgi:hypothetical protein